jgi:hypothetical protein
VADYGLFIGWSFPVRGKEKRSLEVFNEAVAYYAKLQQQGQIESFEVAILEPHGGDLGGFVLLRGQRQKIAQLRVSDEFERLTTRAALVVEGIGVVGAALGDGLSTAIRNFEEETRDL